jgi:hypothetical protein
MQAALPEEAAAGRQVRLIARDTTVAVAIIPLIFKTIVTLRARRTRSAGINGHVFTVTAILYY